MSLPSNRESGVRTFQDLPISRKLSLVTIGTTLAALVLSSAVFLFYDFYRQRASVERDMEILAAVFSEQSTAALAFQDKKATQEILSSLSADPRILHGVLLSADGTTLGQFSRTGHSLTESPTLSDIPRTVRSHKKLDLIRPIDANGERLGYFHICVDLSELYERFWLFSLIILGSLPIGLGLVFLATGRLRQTLVAPILRLVEATQEIAKSGNYDLLVARESRDELGDLVDQFNRMLQAIRERDAELKTHREHLEKEVAARTTELTEANRQLLREKERAEEANVLKSQFLANVSHEIRTPLSGAIGMTELALDTELSDEQREYLELAKSSADSLLDLINDILDFSKIESGKFRLDPVEFRLRDCVAHTVRTLDAKATGKGLELLLEMDPALPANLIGDPGRLRQILVNLIGNAVKFTEKGHIHIRVTAEPEVAGSTWVHFEIQDTGIGIPADKLKLIFEPFVQADGSTTRKYGGTGLGLAISSQLADLMGGRLWAESKAGQGSTFHFRIPFQPASNTSTDSLTKADMETLRGLPVLVVDDNEISRRILDDALRSWGMLPTLAKGTDEALSLFGAETRGASPFRLILLDCQMPGKDGFMLAHELREANLLQDTSLVMLTSGGVRGDAARCREAGIQAYLAKPVTRQELLNTLLMVLSPALELKTRPIPITRHTLRESRPAARILLAEDNPVNQTIIQEHLKKRGYDVVSVADGQEAFNLTKREAFDAVILDLQMPGLGGLEVAESIRSREAFTGAHLPLIALTAHASPSDRERCRAAGMDDYLSKPIRADDLYQAIERHTGKTARSVKSKRELLELMGGDEKLLSEVITLFLEQSDPALSAIEDAAKRGDAAGLERAAHSFKGAASNFGSTDVVDLARELEMMGRNQEMNQAIEKTRALQSAMLSLSQTLRSIQGERAS